MLKRFPKEQTPIENIAYVIDDQLSHDAPGGKLVAFIVYSRGGSIMYLHKEGYNELEVMVAGEAYLGQTLNCGRYKVYKCEIVPEET